MPPNVVYAPIYLESPNERFVNLLNPRIAAHDFSRIFTTLRAYRPEAVIGMYVIHAYPLILLKRILGFSLFSLVSGSDLALHKGIVWSLVRRAVFRNCLTVFTVAAKFNAQIEKESGRQGIVVSTGTNPDYYTPLPNKADLRMKYNLGVDDFVVLSLGSLVQVKCVDDVIRAVKIIHSEYSNTKLIIAGDGPQRSELVRLCSELNVDCTFMGYVGEAVKRELFNIADVYVLASYSEGMPFSVMEAMSCGCVCVCTDVGDLSELIKDSVNGFLIAPRDPNLIALKIREIMSLSEPESRTMRNMARQTVLEKYDFRKLTKEMVMVMEEKISSRNR